MAAVTTSSKAVARHDYENEQVLQRNRIRPRSYHIPADSLLLNGEWAFNYSPTPLCAPTPGQNNLDIATWAKIQVPGHWQLQDWGRPRYTNVVYPFPVNPPFVPSENPTGTYHRQFYIPTRWDTPSQFRLRFDGVDSAFHVFVNGSMVGYSQGSRNPAEFDISNLVHSDTARPNDLIVQVYQYCDGSYIEDQDQWWLSGES